MWWNTQYITGESISCTFNLDVQRATLETCDLWNIWSERWGDMTWPKFDKFWQFEFVEDFYNFGQFWQFLTMFDNLIFLTNLTFFLFFLILIIFDNCGQFEILTIMLSWQFRQLKQFWQLFFLTILQRQSWRLQHLRHWLHFWQLRTWIQTIFVTWQIRVTLDSISNSCDVLSIFPFLVKWHIVRFWYLKHCKNCECCPVSQLIVR